MHHPLATLSRFVVLVGACAPFARAQTAPLDSKWIPYPRDTQLVANQTNIRGVVDSFVVRVEGAAWMRLHFSDVQLAGVVNSADEGLLRITSFLDGATQELDADGVRQWANSSAYFNGEALLVEILASPGSGASRVALRDVEVNAASGGVKTQCGTTDDRVLSSDKRSARALPIGCTAWMIDDCNHCFLTAGHCATGTSVLEFNVPLSTAGGALVHPPPQDQYSVDVTSRLFTNGGVGNDWCYFGVFPNGTTGLTPFDAQNGGTYVLGTPPPFNPAVTIRITGYGVDSSPSTHNQVQQTSTGPYAAFFGTTLQYRCDTEGGNSGSAVQWEQGGTAIGIHTHGGCSTTGGANQGTAVSNAGLQAALGNAAGVCRVVPTSTNYCTAKVSSNGCVPAIATSGLATESGGIGSYTIGANSVMNNKTGLLFYGFSAQAVGLFGGTLCVGGTVTRTAVQFSGGSGSGSDCSGAFAFDMGGWIAAGVDPALMCGKHAYAQYWFRDNGFSVPNNVGFSNAVDFLIGP